MEPQTLELTKPQIRERIKYYNSILTKRTPDIDLILNEVSRVVNIPVETFLTKDRDREFVTARQISMFLARKFTKKSLAVIGEMIGHRDHATVLHAERTIDNLLFVRDREIIKIYSEVLHNLELIHRANSYPPDDISDYIFNTEK